MQTNEFVSEARVELARAVSTPQGGHLRTSDIRKVSAMLYRGLPDKQKDRVFAACGSLLEQRDWALGVVAFDFAYRVRKQYAAGDFALFESWLRDYVRGWGDCDDFCTHAFGELICQNTALAAETLKWTGRREFWMRRAAAVVLIPSIWHDKYRETNPLAVSDALMVDGHDLVRKGYGWMLKVLSTKEPELVLEYLRKNSAIMPRVAFRYALEKFGDERRKILMEK